MIFGQVDNGRTGKIEAYFHSGEVGVREYADRTEIAFYGLAPSVSYPMDVLLDGQPIQVNDVRVSALQPSGNTSKLVAVTLIVLKNN